MLVNKFELQFFTVISWQLLFYEGESNENLRSVIKIRNTARLSCKLTTVILMVWRVADMWYWCRNTTRWRSSSVKMAAPLAPCTNEEQRSVF